MRIYWNLLIRLTIVFMGLLSGEIASQSLKKIESYKVQNRADAFLKLDANRYVLVGQKNENWDSLEKHKVTFRLFDMRDRKTFDLSPPIAEFAASNPDVFIDATPIRTFSNGRSFVQFNTNLVFFDGTKGGLILKNRSRPGQPKSIERTIYLDWDIGSNKINWSKTISELDQFENLDIKVGPNSVESKSILRNLMISIGIDSKNGIYYYRIEKDKDNLGWPSSISILSFSIDSKKIEEVASFSIEKITGGNNFYSELGITASSDFSKLAILEYSELVWKKLVKGHVLDLKSGKMIDFAIPVSPYGVAFDPTNENLLILSNETGKLVKTNLSSLEQETFDSIKGARNLIFSNTGKFVFVFVHGGLVEVRSWPSLKSLKKISVSSLQTGQSAWEPGGSVFSSDGTYATIPESDAVSQLGKSGFHLFSINE
ncbi:hypothetical protein LEP1GSC050_1336 [Leptospira broomii serovar Hurstbridge str. 5399]|uniref:Lactonase, 7-bladed beta-propeller domain protein n=1 Tax=Leptospira broomii serovar Hurstbridge str. 5399 TaxID=1049789 RepID=T0F7M8_9LEPT|nr:hypothetical protein [Leptospira broomii]EQA43507.1 hypothetical protein LEP1GSC050_1336 [Leptospira broomii serovar Hurstbridge str. 5399]